MTSREEDAAVRERVQGIQDEQMIDLIRETVVQLETLADRLERYVNTDEGVHHAGG